ncbi:Ger(x)C family spore germination protein [Bacillus tuaregi]|uniref:Ger(x)C family spore germination protein n=1 Tax=Bacillus tuaregi TaxID=1816695 RepID=UPI0008F87FCD|nr:Ger(x)C family spore germination protein [Bacillus tuaregi]
MKPHKYSWKKYVVLFSVFFLLLPLLTGCWDSREIEKRATILAIGIDMAEPGAENREEEVSHSKKNIPIHDEQMIELSAQIAIPGRIPLGPEIGGGEQNPVLVVRVIGHTIEDCLLTIQQEVAEQIFLGHLRLIILNEQVAREGVSRFNDYLRRNPRIRRTASLVISKEKALTYMKLKPELERVPSLYLAEMVDSLIQLGKFPPSFIGLFWSTLSSQGQEGYLPYFQIKGKSNIQINGLAYFKDDKMVGKTTPNQIGIFMAGIGAGKGGYGVMLKIPEMEQTALVRAVERKTKLKPVFKNGKPHVTLKVHYECEMEEVESTTSSNIGEKDLKKLEKGFSEDIVQNLEELIKETQKEKSDVFGFGEHFRAKHPKYWKEKVKTKERWREIYGDLSYDIKVTTYIRRTGMKAK